MMSSILLTQSNINTGKGLFMFMCCSSGSRTSALTSHQTEKAKPVYPKLFSETRSINCTSFLSYKECQALILLELGSHFCCSF